MLAATGSIMNIEWIRKDFVEYNDSCVAQGMVGMLSERCTRLNGVNKALSSMLPMSELQFGTWFICASICSVIS